MVKPERYQMGFDFGRKPDSSLVYYELGFAGNEHQQEGANRFVRQLREEILVRTPQDAAHHLLTSVFRPFHAFDQEELWALILNTKNRITHETMIYRGTVNAINVRPAELFKEAVRVNAPALLLSHIHPSGEVEPSLSDVQVTEEAIAAGNILGVELLDHIIVGRESWMSMREESLGFGSQQ